MAAANRTQVRTFDSSSPNTFPHAHILSSLPNSTSRHPRAVDALLTLRLAKAPRSLDSPIIFRVIQKITGSCCPHPASCASGRSMFFCGVEAPILRIRANDGIVPPALPPVRSNLSSCSDQSSPEKQGGGNNICSKEMNSCL